ncbi:MAG: glycosyltransferase 87 family protein [Streptosporangiaceae bacterium]
MTAGNRSRAIPPAAGDISGATAGGGQTATAWMPAAAGILFTISLAALVAVFRAFPHQLWSMLDLHVYIWGGRLVRHSRDPYLHAYQNYNLYFTYTPMAAAFFALLAGIKLHTLKWLVTAASVGSLVAVLWLTWGKLGYRRSASRFGATLAVAALALWIEPVQQTLAFGQVNLILMLVIVADMCLPDGCRWKGIGVGLAAGFKLTPLIFIPYLLLTRRFRAAAVSAVTFGLTIIGVFALMPAAAHRYWIGGLYSSPDRIGNVAYVGNQSLYGALVRLLGGTAAARPYWLAAAVVAGAAGLLLAAWASRRGQEILGILTCALTGLLVSPVSWSHHWVWIAPVLVVLAHFAVRQQSVLAPRLWRWAGWLGAVIVAALFFAYPFRLAPGAPVLPEGLLWAVPAPAVQGAAMTGFQQLGGDLYVLVGLAALAAIAGALALTRRPAPAALSGREAPLPAAPPARA